jgi:subtilase family serine protease
MLAALGLTLIPSTALAAAHVKYHKDVCGPVTGKKARCASQVRTKGPGPDAAPLATTSYQNGYVPADLRSAYNLAAAALSNGGSQTVAIVDAYDDPTAESDLAAYRNQFNLGDCTTSNGCFRKVNQNGGSTPPAGDTGWGQEISLDLDMVSAICPNCHILLVEANSASYADLAAAVDRAAAMGATQISNSYGGSEAFGSAYESHYNHQGIDITVSSGDSGYGVEFPASSPHVTAVGGTHLVRNTSTRGWFESVWSGAGSGCSSVFAKPSWQHDTGCSRRSVADVAAVADPNTGVAVYDSYGSSGGANWYVFGGTSVASPIIAAVDALDGGRSPGATYGSFPYSNPSLFYDITGGTNGSCRQTYLCTGVLGYDGPTGMGTPNGVRSSSPPPAAPVNIDKPVINNTTPTEGQTLTTTNGTWSNSPTSFAYQWSCSGGCTNPTGTSSYVVDHLDVGKTISVTVTAHNTAGDTPASSDSTQPVAAIPADFSLSVTPSSQSVRRGGSVSYTVTITPSGGFSGQVTLSAGGGPSGTTQTFSVNPATTSSVMTVQTTASAAQGNYTLTVSGVSGSLTHSASATLSVRKH